MTISGMIVPIFFLLIFVGIFGHTLHAGLGAAVPVGGHYVDYLAPGVILLTASSSAESTAVNICTDMNEGIIARFRTMAITGASVLTGQVLGSLIRVLISVALVIGVAVGLGFRPTANPVEWLAAVGVFAMLTLALTWLAVAFGLLAKTPAGDTASTRPAEPARFPFVSSGAS
jgi:ABC-2 type transport system permease protein